MTATTEQRTALCYNLAALFRYRRNKQLNAAVQALADGKDTNESNALIAHNLTQLAIWTFNADTLRSCKAAAHQLVNYGMCAYTDLNKVIKQ